MDEEAKKEALNEIHEKAMGAIDHINDGENEKAIKLIEEIIAISRYQHIV